MAPGIVRTLFTRHVQLRRVDGEFRVVLDGAAPPAPDAATTAARQMQGELCALLDAAEGSRRVLRPLAVIEHHLRRRDSALFIHDLPLPTLQRALRQLGGLAPRRTPGLVALRTCLLDAIALRERLQKEEDARRPVSSFIGNGKVQVAEASLSDFERTAADS